MLIDFSVSNYKSFDYTEDLSSQSISMVPTSIRSKPDHIGSSNLLKTAAVFGANSSGKSSLFDAVKFIKSIITNKKELKDKQSVLYCLNNEDNDSKVSEFRFHFLVVHRLYPIKAMSDYDIEDSLFDMFRKEFVYKIQLKLGFGDDYDIISESLDRVYGDQIEPVCSWSSSVTSEYYELQKEIMDAARGIEEHSFKTSKFYRYFRSEPIRRNIELVNQKIDNLKRNDPIYQEQRSSLMSELQSLLSQLNELDDEIQHEIDDGDDGVIFGYEENRYDDLIHRLSQMEHNMTSQSMVSLNPDIDSLISDYGLTLGIFRNDEVKEMLIDVYNWFNQTVEVVDPHRFLLPNIHSDSFTQLTQLIREFDIGIADLRWTSFDDKDSLDCIYHSLPVSDQELLEECKRMSMKTPIECSMVISDITGLYLFSFISGYPVIKKLVTVHENDPTFHDIIEESNGTRRLIELATVLLNMNVDKVYFVDELDCRLHPLITRFFMDRFFELSNNKNADKQLLITTHESRLMTTDLFRLDEIWLIDRDQNGCSFIHNAADSMKVPYHKRLDKMYLEDQVMGGVPNINQEGHL